MANPNPINGAPISPHTKFEIGVETDVYIDGYLSVGDLFAGTVTAVSSATGDLNMNGFNINNAKTVNATTLVTSGIIDPPLKVALDGYQTQITTNTNNIAEIETDLGELVPYLGANQAVNLNSQNLTTTGAVSAGSVTDTGLTDGYLVANSAGQLITSNWSQAALNTALDGYLATTIATATYVPYTGANANVNLGSRTLTTTGTASTGALTATSVTDTGLTDGYIVADANGQLVNSNWTQASLNTALDGYETITAFNAAVSGAAGFMTKFVGVNAVGNSNWTEAQLNTALDGYAVAANFVPYTGATGTVNLGSQALTTSGNVTGGQIIDSGLTSGSIVKATTSGQLANSNWTEAALNTALDGYLTTSSATSTYVPYTGANADVNLGSHALTTSGTIIGGSIKDSALSNTFLVKAGAAGVLQSSTVSDFNMGNLVNAMTTLGDMIYCSADGSPGTPARVPGQSTTQQFFLSQTGTGTVSAEPVWTLLPVAGIIGYVFAAGHADVDSYYDAYQSNVFVPTPTLPASVTVSSATNNQLLETFITPATYPDITNIPAGIVNIYIDASATAACNIYATVSARAANGSYDNLLFTTGNYAVSTSGEAQVQLSYTNAVIPLTAATDRLVVRFYANITSGTPDITLYWDGTNPDTNAGFTIPALALSTVNYVPYNGATANVHLGQFTLTAGATATGAYGVTGKTTGTNGAGGNFSGYYGVVATGTQNVGVLSTGGSNSAGGHFTGGGGGAANGVEGVGGSGSGGHGVRGTGTGSGSGGVFTTGPNFSATAAGASGTGRNGNDGIYGVSDSGYSIHADSTTGPYAIYCNGGEFVNGKITCSNIVNLSVAASSYDGGNFTGGGTAGNGVDGYGKGNGFGGYFTPNVKTTGNVIGADSELVQSLSNALSVQSGYDAVLAETFSVVTGNTVTVPTGSNVEALGPLQGAGLSITGEIKMWSTNTAPSGWLLCDGSAVSRTTYAVLFSVIGIIYGAGNGSTTFNLPNGTDAFPVGAGNLYAIGSTGGTTAYTPAGTVSSHTHGPGSYVTTAAGTVASHTHTMGNHTHTVTSHSHPLSSNGQACISVVGSGQLHQLAVGNSFAQNITAGLGSGNGSGTSTSSSALQGNTDGSTPVASGTPSTNTSDATAPAFTGSSTSITGTSDTTQPTFTGTAATLTPPYFAVRFIIKT